MVCFYKWGDGLGWNIGWRGWTHSDGAAGVRQAVGGVNLEERVLWVERACESGVGEWARPFLDFSKNAVDRVWRYVIQGYEPLSELVSGAGNALFSPKEAGPSLKMEARRICFRTIWRMT